MLLDLPLQESQQAFITHPSTHSSPHTSTHLPTRPPIQPPSNNQTWLHELMLQVFYAASCQSSVKDLKTGMIKYSLNMTSGKSSMRLFVSSTGDHSCCHATEGMFGVLRLAWQKHRFAMCKGIA